MAITAILDNEMIGRLVECDIGRMRYLEHQLLEQLVVLTSCVSSFFASEVHNTAGMLSVRNALVDLSACIQSIQKWIAQAREVPRFQILSSHALHHAENKCKNRSSCDPPRFFKCSCKYTYRCCY